MKYGANAFINRLKGQIPTMRRTDEKSKITIYTKSRSQEQQESLAVSEENSNYWDSCCLKFSKSNIMYWQQCFDRVNLDLHLRIAIEVICKDYPNYGYRSLLPLLQSRGIVVNKKRFQWIMQKFNLQVVGVIKWKRINII